MANPCVKQMPMAYTAQSDENGDITLVELKNKRAIEWYHGLWNVASVYPNLICQFRYLATYLIAYLGPR